MCQVASMIQWGGLICMGMGVTDTVKRKVDANSLKQVTLTLA